MRIGTNHGSLSDRIMSRYGDTPEGMVESAMEFIRICEDLNFQELVISMKSSNPQVMVQAYRLLVEKMVHEGMNYPLHLGVTEAGDGEDGRIKSAVGIGTLLEDGLGDTIRVSLTEEPELEIPVAQALVNRYAHPIKNDSHSTKADTEKFEFHCIEPYPSQTVNAFIGTGFVPRIVAGLSREKLLDPFVLHDLGYRYDPLLDKFHVTDQSVDFVYLGTQLPSFAMPGNLKQLYDWPAWQALSSKTNCHPLLSLTQYLSICENHSLFSQTFAHGKLDAQLFLVKIRHQDLDDPSFEKFIPHSSLIFVLETDSLYQGMRDQRIFFQKIRTFGFEQPVIIKREYPAADFAGPIGNMMDSDEPVSKLQLYAGTDFGALLLDGMGQGVWIDAPSLPNKTVVSTAFGVLQATRSRISKTEYISCPSCGRTLFDLQETTQMIRNRTNHLKGLKIGIMGCIVNGPGEMADADYGYVGAGPDKITLYRGKEIVKKNVSSTNALDELIQIIKSDGKWIDLP